MKILLPIVLSAILAPTAGIAQSFDLAGEIGSTESQAEEIKLEKAEEQVADDRGIFSFLNFSFIKKPSLLKSDQTKDDSAREDSRPDETPLQKMLRLADAGNIDAQLALGYMYLYGESGVKSDFAKAFHYYEMAAAQNDKIALNNLGSLYFNGIGTKVDYIKAAQLFAQAAQQGSDDAAVNLAFIYLSGDSKNKNLDAAVDLFKQAAQAGNNTAKFMLGYAYYRGFRIERNFHEAVKLMKESAAAGFDEAQYILGLMYMNGQGIAKNYGNAVKYLRLSYAQGNIPATMQLADILTKGVMYPKNIPQAHILYNIASVYGAEGAAERRDQLEPGIKIEDLLRAQSQAEQFKSKPSELTAYIRQTFGSNVRRYIDENIEQQPQK